MQCKNVIEQQDIELQLVQLFPKSRKIVFQNGQPYQPMGWVELRPVSVVGKEK